MIDGRRPLHYAADYGQKEIIEYLIKQGANVNVSFLFLSSFYSYSCLPFCFLGLGQTWDFPPSGCNLGRAHRMRPFADCQRRPDWRPHAGRPQLPRGSRKGGDQVNAFGLNRGEWWSAESAAWKQFWSATNRQWPQHISMTHLKALFCSKRFVVEVNHRHCQLLKRWNIQTTRFPLYFYVFPNTLFLYYPWISLFLSEPVAVQHMFFIYSNTWTSLQLFSSISNPLNQSWNNPKNQKKPLMQLQSTW